LLQRRPPRSSPFPYTTLFRSDPHDPRARTFDHIRPRSEGGRFTKSNGVACINRPLWRHAPVVSPESVWRMEMPRQPMTLLVISADRKSTRLNSSHVKSSYAVF